MDFHQHTRKHNKHSATTLLLNFSLLELKVEFRPAPPPSAAPPIGTSLKSKELRWLFNQF